MGVEQSKPQRPSTPARATRSSDTKRPRPPRNQSSASTATLETPKKVKLDDLLEHASPARHTTGFDAQDTLPSRIDQRVALPLSPLNRLKSTKTQLSPVLLLQPTLSDAGKRARSVSPVRQVPALTAETIGESPEALALIHRRSLLYAANPGSQTRRPKEVPEGDSFIAESLPSSVCESRNLQQCNAPPIHQQTAFVAHTRPQQHDFKGQRQRPVPDRGETPVPVNYTVGPYRRGTLRIVNRDRDEDEVLRETSEPMGPDSLQDQKASETHSSESSQRTRAFYLTLEDVQGMGAASSHETKRKPTDTKSASAPLQKIVSHTASVPDGHDATQQHRAPATAISVERHTSASSSLRSSVVTDYSAARCPSSCSSAVSEQAPKQAPVPQQPVVQVKRNHGKSPAQPTQTHIEPTIPAADSAISPAPCTLTDSEKALIAANKHKPYRVKAGRGRPIEVIMQAHRSSSGPISPASTAESLNSASTLSSTSSNTTGGRRRKSKIPLDYEPFGPISPITLQSKTKYYTAPSYFSAQCKLADPDLGMRKGYPRPLEQLTRQNLIRSGSENALLRVKPRGPRPVVAEEHGSMKRGVSMGCLAEVSLGNIQAQDEGEVKQRSLSGADMKQGRTRRLAGDEA